VREPYAHRLFLYFVTIPYPFTNPFKYATILSKPKPLPGKVKTPIHTSSLMLPKTIAVPKRPESVETGKIAAHPHMLLEHTAVVLVTRDADGEDVMAICAPNAKLVVGDPVIVSCYLLTEAHGLDEPTIYRVATRTPRDPQPKKRRRHSSKKK
jgi:hypothetical protein